MIKLYFKKLFTLVFGLYMVSFVYRLGRFPLETLSNFFSIAIIRLAILLGVPMLIVLSFVWKRRVGDQNEKAEYMKYLRGVSGNDIRINIKKELEYIKNFVDFKAELYAAVTVTVPVVAVMCFSGNSNVPLFIICLASIIIAVVTLLVYTVSDFVFWMLIHKVWIK